MPLHVIFEKCSRLSLGTVGEHSSFDELQALVRDIRPRRLVPTVNSESFAAKARFELEAITHQALPMSDIVCTCCIAYVYKSAF